MPSQEQRLHWPSAREVLAVWFAATAYLVFLSVLTPRVSQHFGGSRLAVLVVGAAVLPSYVTLFIRVQNDALKSTLRGAPAEVSESGKTADGSALKDLEKKQYYAGDDENTRQQEKSQGKS
jgi:hypothetical protein